MVRLLGCSGCRRGGGALLLGILICIYNTSVNCFCQLIVIYFKRCLFYYHHLSKNNCFRVLKNFITGNLSGDLIQDIQGVIEFFLCFLNYVPFPLVI